MNDLGGELFWLWFAGMLAIAVIAAEVLSRLRQILELLKHKDDEDDVKP